MLPAFAMNDECIASVPMPRGFRKPSGEIIDVQVSPSVTRIVAGVTAAQKNGLRYEARAQEHLCETLGKFYWRSPRLAFKDDSGSRLCYPDGVYRHDAIIVVFEIKLRHMPEAWWQLEHLYRPVLKKAFPDCTVRCVEVVKDFDPSMPFPCRVERLRSTLDILSIKSFGVLQWTP